MLVGTWTWQLPFFKEEQGIGRVLGGWEVSGIGRFQSGAPLTITGDTSIGNRRADFLGGDPYLPESERFDPVNAGIVRWFNPAAFAIAPEGRRGNSTRGQFQGPSLQIWDLSLRKRFAVAGDVKAAVPGRLLQRVQPDELPVQQPDPEPQRGRIRPAHGHRAAAQRAARGTVDLLAWPRHRRDVRRKPPLRATRASRPCGRADALRAHLDRSGIPLGFDPELSSAPSSPLAAPIEVDGVRVGNRFCILPMEGWDGTREGQPSELTRAALAQLRDAAGPSSSGAGKRSPCARTGRANPNQLADRPRHTRRRWRGLREHLVAAHRERFGAGADADLYVGLQLTHSGRFARPHVKDRPEPLVAYAHPVLDRRFPGGVRRARATTTSTAWSRTSCARRGWPTRAGYQFVDVKHCHGYLGHELL